MYRPGEWKCTSCAAWGRCDDLHFVCNSCCDAVCPNCAGMDHRDIDDPMPKVGACPDCVRAEGA